MQISLVPQNMTFCCICKPFRKIFGTCVYLSPFSRYGVCKYADLTKYEKIRWFARADLSENFNLWDLWNSVNIRIISFMRSVEHNTLAQSAIEIIVSAYPDNV